MPSSQGRNILGTEITQWQLKTRVLPLPNVPLTSLLRVNFTSLIVVKDVIMKHSDPLCHFHLMSPQCLFTLISRCSQYMF